MTSLAYGTVIKSSTPASAWARIVSEFKLHGDLTATNLPGIAFINLMAHQLQPGANIEVTTSPSFYKHEGYILDFDGKQRLVSFEFGAIRRVTYRIEILDGATQDSSIIRAEIRVTTNPFYSLRNAAWCIFCQRWKTNFILRHLLRELGPGGGCS